MVEKKIGCAHEHVHALPNTMRGKRLQYGLSHHVTTTIHGCQGDNLHKLRIWDKAQVVVLLSRTRMAKDIIFVGDPQSIMS